MEQNAQELFSEYSKTRDIVIRNKIVEKYLYIAEILAKKYSGRGVDFDDIYQVGATSLIKAVEKYDLNFGIKFVTFATPSVAGEIKNYFRDKSRIIKMPRKCSLINNKIKLAIDEFKQKYEKTPTTKELSEIILESEEDIIFALESQNTAISLDQETEDGSSLYQIMPDEKNYYEIFEDKELIKDMMKSLPEKERELIYLRFVKNYNQTKISERWNVSQMFVSRLERKVLQKLKNYV